MPKKSRRPAVRQPCESRHALVVAKWEGNRTAWRQGKYFELKSKSRGLQETIGEGGTLWVVISRPRNPGRFYTLSFKLSNCRPHTYAKHGKFGRYAVRGHPEHSRFFAASDARELLLALRFSPWNPINGPTPSQISNSIRVPRCLSPSDIELIKAHAGRLDRWSVFVSYRRQGDKRFAAKLSDALQDRGLAVFRDQQELRAGDTWWATIKRAISRSRRLVVIVGRRTHESRWVRREIRHALTHKVPVVPVFNGGDLASWGRLEARLAARQGLDASTGLQQVVDGLIWRDG